MAPLSQAQWQRLRRWQFHYRHSKLVQQMSKQQKELTITYPEIEGFTNYYKIDNGEEVEATVTQTVTLTHNASITAIVRDNSNSQNQVNSTYVETKIDSAAPVISNTNITTSNIGETVATIRYQQASDDFTANLKYSICISTSSIDSSYCLQNQRQRKKGRRHIRLRT